MEEFIGFENIIYGFKKRADKNTLSHAHLIVGLDGIGKSIMARIFSLTILGKNIDHDYVDIIHYRPKKASFGVDEVRGIIEEVSKKPYEGDKKVIIIHEGSKLTVQAQNALLKTIEEPPKGVYIILLVESLETMLDTIKSRCQIYKLTPLNRDDMIKYINRLGELDGDKILAALAYGEGIPGRAERMLKDEKLESLRTVIVDVLKDVSNGGTEIVLEYESKLNDFKDEMDELLNLFASFIRDIIVYKELENRNIIINADKFDYICELANSLSYKKLNVMLDKVREARFNLMNNTNYSMTISVMLIGFVEG